MAGHCLSHGSTRSIVCTIALCVQAHIWNYVDMDSLWHWLQQHDNVTSLELTTASLEMGCGERDEAKCLAIRLPGW